MNAEQDADFSDEFCRFLQTRVASVDAAEALLREKPHPSEAEIRTALDSHLCRCGSHNRIVRAIHRAAKERQG